MNSRFDSDGTSTTTEWLWAEAAAHGIHRAVDHGGVETEQKADGVVKVEDVAETDIAVAVEPAVHRNP